MLRPMANLTDVDVSRQMKGFPEAMWAVIADLHRARVAGVRRERRGHLRAGAGRSHLHGATVHVHWAGAPKGVMGKLMRPMMQKRITQSWERSLEALGRVASM
jgi:hypothetical protein